MKRGLTGEYQERLVGGEKVRAFIPSPLPPSQPVELDGHQNRLLEQATIALGRLFKMIWENLKEIWYGE